MANALHQQSELTSTDKQAILADFTTWSGGFDPAECDDDQVRAYADASRDHRFSEIQVLSVLRGKVTGC
jgi:hypothetical protein